MNYIRKSVFAWILAAVACIVLLSTNSYAAGNTFKFGPGDHYDELGNIVSLSGDILVPAAEVASRVTDSAAAASVAASSAVDTVTRTAVAQIPAPIRNYQITGSGEDAVYTFEGVQYQKGASWGCHKLSGYTEVGVAAKTSSGKIVKAHHTAAASSDLPLGTVIIVEGAEGPNASDYNGLYVVEDRGGYYLEQEGWLDLYFDTAEEADYVTHAGWNTANVWIAEKK